MESTVSSEEYFARRSESLLQLEKEGKIELYPHKFNVTIELQDFRETYNRVENGVTLEDVTESVTGRIETKRDSSRKLHFFTILNNNVSLQVMSNMAQYEKGEEDFVFINTLLKRGDIIGITGHPTRTKTGELTILAKNIILLSPCYHNLPFTDKLVDMETRHRNRYLDLIVNTRQNQIYRMRAKVIKFIRDYYDQRGYVEVETPMMNIIPGGANARPFITYHNDLHSNMFLRIAPELFLKQCVIGGLNRVYEIGKNFRNEGIDLTHNPEYTAIETYCAYDDFFDVMKTTEELLSTMVKELTGNFVIDYVLKNGEKCQIDFTPPFRRVPMMSSLEEILNITFPTDFTSPEMHEFLVNLLKEKNLTCIPATVPKMLDTLVGEYLEPMLINPGFITEHPQIMSPLAKWHRKTKGLTERFELFVAGRELCNAYTELNNPFVQRATFLSEQTGRDAGDDEAQMVDESFCVSLEYGLPPTAGWGMGIVRLVMLLTQQTSIMEVILFPTMKPLDREKLIQRQMGVHLLIVRVRGV
jgi:lysyl-tRNA synthetase class 2